MINLKHLFKEYNCNLNLKLLKEAKKEIVHEDPIQLDTSSSQDLEWPIEFLPKTKYSLKTSESYLEIIEKWNKIDVTKMKNNKIVKILTKIDLDLIKAVTAEDLISFEGIPSSIAVSHILNKNSSLQLFISTKFSKRRIFSMLKYALKYQNYNLVYVLIKSLQSMKLSIKRIEKLVIYKDVLEKQENGIFPFEWMLQDCEDSNLNISSEVASLRFCKIVDKLKSMKNLTYDFAVSDRSIHIIYAALWKSVKTSNWIVTQEKSESDTNLFLIL